MKASRLEAPHAWGAHQHLLEREFFFVELMTSDRKLKATREGSKGRDESHVLLWQVIETAGKAPGSTCTSSLTSA